MHHVPNMEIGFNRAQDWTRRSGRHVLTGPETFWVEPERSRTLRSLVSGTSGHRNVGMSERRASGPEGDEVEGKERAGHKSI